MSNLPSWTRPTTAGEWVLSRVANPDSLMFPAKRAMTTVGTATSGSEPPPT